MARPAFGIDLSLAPRPAGGKRGPWLRQELCRAIAEGKLRPGSRLPSTRELACQYDLARSTVVNVYEQLQGEGYLCSNRGGGTWVDARLPAFPPVKQRANLSVILLSGPLTGLTYPYPPRPFRLHEAAVDQFPIKVWARLAGRRLRQASPELLRGRDRRGYAPLREALANYLGAARGVRCSPEQIFITTGVQQALDWIARLLLRPHEPAGIEDPGYFGARLAWQNAGAKLVPMPVDEHGLNPFGLRTQPRLVYLTPGHQFPLGMTMPLVRRLQVLAWAQKSKCFLVEDDYDSEYRFAGPPTPALFSLDKAARVILVGSFNKLMFPALRLGYIVVPEDLVEALAELRFAVDLNTYAVDQAIMADFIDQGDLARHLRRMRELYGARLAVLRRLSEQYLAGLIELASGVEGLFATAFLRNGMTSGAAESAATAAGVETMGLHRLAVAAPDPRAVLLGFGGFNPSALRAGVLALARALGGP